MPKLSIALDSGKTTHELSDELVTIGRAPDNSLSIDDPSVSSRHARLVLVDGRYELSDLDSTNGTRVNGDAVTKISLRIGDRIRFGKVEARYESDATGAAQALALPPPGEIEARPAETSAKPADFANASPFPNRKKVTDKMATAVYAAAALSVVVFLFSLLRLIWLHGPESFTR